MREKHYLLSNSLPTGASGRIRNGRRQFITEKYCEKISVQPVTIASILKLWIENAQTNLKGSTIMRYNYLIDTHLIPDIGMLEIKNLNASVLNAYAQQKMEIGRLDGTGGLSSAYVRSMMVILTSALKYAETEQYCEPIKGKIIKPSIGKSELQLLDRQTQKRYGQYLTEHCNTYHLGILISMYTGLRIGEICALTWEDVDLQAGILWVRHTVARVHDSVTECSKLIIDKPKTKSSIRQIPIPSKLLPIMRNYEEKDRKVFLLTGTNSFLNPHTFDYQFRKTLRECGIKPINFHALRHTFATRCIESGMDVKTLSEILGHADVAITLNTYVHSSMELKRKEIEKLFI